MNLNIIGNGFDLYHGLPSSYYYFGCFLIDVESEFYEYIGEMYNLTFRKVSRTYPDLEYELVVEDIFWSDFESHLGEVNEEFIVGTYPDDLGLETDDPIDIDMNEDAIAERIKEAFINWVRSTLDKKENYRYIKKNMKNSKKKLSFGKEDYFLNFNYTHTLQEIYDISDEKICYIHGECAEDEEDLIVGHGNDKKIRDIRKKIEEYELNKYSDYYQSSRNRKNEYKCLLRYIEKMRKDVGTCMSKCIYFYSKIEKEIDCIKVYGLSMGDVDIFYLEDLRRRYPLAKWEFAYYDDKGKERSREVAEEVLGLSDNEWRQFEFNNPLYKKIRKEIVKRQGITEYRWMEVS